MYHMDYTYVHAMKMYRYCVMYVYLCIYFPCSTLAHMISRSSSKTTVIVYATGIIKGLEFIQQKTSNLVKALRPLVT